MSDDGADIINLRKARKEKSREEKKKQAAANRDKFGQSKADKRVVSFEKAKVVELLDGAKRDKDAPDNNES